jgi:hypothetical protein
MMMANQIAASNAGWRMQFRYAVHVLLAGLAGFYHWVLAVFQ